MEHQPHADPLLRFPQRVCGGPTLRKPTWQENLDSNRSVCNNIGQKMSCCIASQKCQQRLGASYAGFPEKAAKPNGEDAKEYRLCLLHPLVRDCTTCVTNIPVGSERVSVVYKAKNKQLIRISDVRYAIPGYCKDRLLCETLHRKWHSPCAETNWVYLGI